MVRIRHPNLFVDKRDRYLKKMPTFCDKKMARVANKFFDFFMRYRNFCELFSITNFAKSFLDYSILQIIIY